MLVIAAWCLYSAKWVNRHGGKLDIVDEKKEALHEAAKLTGKDKLAFCMKANRGIADSAIPVFKEAELQ